MTVSVKFTPRNRLTDQSVWVSGEIITTREDLAGATLLLQSVKNQAP